MKLRDWCQRNGLTLSDVMRRSGVAYTTVLRATEGRLGRYDVAQKISDVTGGEVSIAELCGDTDEEDPAGDQAAE